jgi:hypothetical protein
MSSADGFEDVKVEEEIDLSKLYTEKTAEEK